MMYTRSYNEDGVRTLPEGYGGTMFEEAEAQADTEHDARDGDGANGDSNERTAPAMSWLTRLGDNFGSLFDIPFLKNMKIGTEELLIGATALFLLFSKNGDKECAIMFLLLLFIR